MTLHQLALILSLGAVLLVGCATTGEGPPDPDRPTAMDVGFNVLFTLPGLLLR